MHDARYVLVPFLTLSAALLAQADTLALIDGLTQYDSNGANRVFKPTILAPHLTFEGTTIAIESDGGYLNIASTSLAGSVSGGWYAGFRIIPDAGYTFDITSFGFDLGVSDRNGLSLGQAYAMTSLGGFTAASPTIAAGTVIDATSDGKIVWTSVLGTSVGTNPTYQNLADPLLIRLYLVAGPNPNGIYLDNLRLEGKVRPVPEPASLLALAGGALALLRRARKSSRFQTAD